MPIDLDRGVEERKLPNGKAIFAVRGHLKEGGDPHNWEDFIGAEWGMYYDAHGDKVHANVARSAGFDVEQDELNAETAARKKAIMEQANAAYERQLNSLQKSRKKSEEPVDIDLPTHADGQKGKAA